MLFVAFSLGKSLRMSARSAYGGTRPWIRWREIHCDVKLPAFRPVGLGGQYYYAIRRFLTRQVSPNVGKECVWGYSTVDSMARNTLRCQASRISPRRARRPILLCYSSLSH